MDIINILAENSIFASAFAGILTAFIGILSVFLQRGIRSSQSEENREIESITKAIREVQEAKRLSIVESTVEKLPVSLTSDQFTRLIQEISARTSQNSSTAIDRVPIENLISSYHGQALGQARVQFWVSIVAAVVGFAWILYFGANIDSESLATISKTLPGIVTEVVAFLFFRQASETRQRATELYDRLRRDKQLAESVALVASIEDVRVKSAVKAQIALHMSGLEHV
jgi:hypothetical protein